MVHDRDLLLRQPLVGRVATALAAGVGGFLLGFACLIQLPGQVGAPLVLVWLAVSLAGGVRGYRLAVLVAADTVVVRGILWTRTVPRCRVTGVTDLPALRWRDGSGRDRHTPLTVLMTSNRELGGYQRMKEAQLARLRRHLGR